MYVHRCVHTYVYNRIRTHNWSTGMLEWHWRGVQDEIDQSFDPALEALMEIGKTHDFCVTGDVRKPVFNCG